MSDKDLMFDLVQRFAASMLSTFETNDMLYELCDTATTMLDAAGAGVSVAADAELLFVTATSQSVVDVEHAQETQQAGPCIEAYRTGKPIAISNIDDLDRWPAYQKAAAAAGFESVAGLPLVIGDDRIGSLDVFDSRRRDWSDHDVRAAGVLADMATTYIVRAGELAAVTKLSAQLQHALDTRIVIEQAKGMLARDHDIDVDQAFEMLRRLSRDRSTPLRTIAEAVVTLGLRLPPVT
ncbi:MAG: GAF and ANTAR domain-containing protein [Ilumatobacter sp.]|uniref:GAF and ANTAR domain-containing protein n=1 Tax=Ilumatobacter sp. TaxID=1967498 RepID=UPI003C74FDE0